MDDLLVVGAGPSGLAAAMHARLQGMRVRVLDYRENPIDKACGEGVMPGGVRLLQQMGVNPIRYRPFQGIRYIDGQRTAEGLFPHGTGWGVRRTVLHEALLQRAAEMDVTLSRHRVQHLQQDAHGVRVDDYRAPFLIAADGLGSPIRKQLGMQLDTRWPNRYGLRQHFEVEPWTDFVEVHWARDAEAYVTPVDDKLVGVALLFGDQFRERMRAAAGREEGSFYRRALGAFPSLEARCGTGASRVCGAGPFATRASSQVCGRVLLAGDAAGYLDPLTGEGIKLGMRSAVAAVEAILQGDTASYPRAWNKITRHYRWGTGSLLLLRRRESLRRLIVPALNAVPPLFGALLGQLDG